MKPGAIFALFIIAIMLLSSLGYYFLGSDSSSNQPANSDVPQQPPAPVQKQYTNSNLQVKVLDTFNTIIVLGPTSEAVIGKIDAQISSIPGVVGIQSEYVTSQLGVQLLYRATVEVSPETDKLLFSNQLPTMVSLLQSFELYQSAVVELPKKLPVQETGLPGGQVGEQTVIDLESQLSQAFVNLNTEKNDLLIVNFQGVFEGSKLIQGGSVEIDNLSKTPQQSSVELTLPLNEFTLRAVGSATMPYAYLTTESSLQEQFSKIPTVTGVAVTVPYLNTLLVVNREDINSLELALQPVISTDDRIESFQFFPTTLSVYLTPGTNLPEIKSFLLAEIEKASLVSREVTFTDPSPSSFYIDMNLSANDNFSLIDGAFIGLVDSYHFTNAQLFQVGRSSLTSITVPDTNQILSLDENNSTFEFLVKPGHTIGEEIESIVTFVYVGEKVIAVQGNERVDQNN